MRRGVILFSALMLALAMNGGMNDEALARSAGCNSNTSNNCKGKNDENSKSAKTKAPRCTGNCTNGHDKPKPLTEAEKKELKQKADQHLAEVRERKANQEAGGPSLMRLHAGGGGHSKSDSSDRSDRGGPKF